MIIKKNDPIRLEAIADLGCVICGNPPQIHHLRRNPITGEHYGLSQKAPDTFTIPLCIEHHTYGPWAYHSGPRVFEERFGSEATLWDKVNHLLAVRLGQ